MSWRIFLPYLAVMAVVTYLIRMLPLTVFRRPIRSRFVQSFLSYIPYAVLGAMTFPDVLYSTGDLRTAAVGTGLAMALPEGWFAAVFARSGLAVKQGLRPANCVGVCDADYRGEYIVPLYNDSTETRVVENGERIAQMVLLPCRTLEFRLTETLDDTDRGEGGFGSTGTH